MGLDPIQAIAPVDNFLGSGAGQLGSSADPLQLTNEQLEGLDALDDGFEESSNAGITQPLGNSLAPLVDAVDTRLDPLTDPVDDAVLEPVLDAAAPVTNPVLNALEPLVNPFDEVVADLTGGSVQDALTNDDKNKENGNGVVNDLLGGKRKSNNGRESGETSPLPVVSNGIGKALGRTARPVERALDSVTDPVDRQVFAPVLEAVAPVSEPVLFELEPATAPVDGTLADVTGGSVEDALTNRDDNTADGDGLINDIFSDGSEGSASGSGSGDLADSPVFGPIVEVVDSTVSPVVEPIIGVVDTTLDPVTDPIDTQVAPILDVIAPVTEPVLDTAAPIVDPVDEAFAGVGGGSIGDALTNSDENTADGNGLVNDLLGGDSGAGGDSGGSADNGGLLAPVIDVVDTSLDPVTDPIDAQVAPILDVIVPVTEPVLDAAAPIVDPVDEVFAGAGGGSIGDALTNSDGNTADGNGLVNDLLGGDSGATDSDSSADSDGLLEPVIEVVDATLDPVTDPIDAQVAPILDVIAPVTEPVLDAAAPIVDPVDETFAGVGGGSIGDALTNSDGNTADGNGLVNDLLGGDSGAGGDSGGSADNGGLLEPVIEVVDTTLDPVTDPIDSLVEPILGVVSPVTDPVADALDPVVEPVDVVVADLGAGSVGDALTNEDDNTADGNGAVNDLLGGDEDTSGSADSSESGGLGDIADSPVFGPIVEAVDATLNPVVEPAVEVVDTTLDPVTDPVDDQVVEPVLGAVSPVTEPVVSALDPIVEPVDVVVADLGAGSVGDALTNEDDNTADGNGAVNDLLGGDEDTSGSADSSESGGLGDIADSPVFGPIVEAVDAALNPVVEPAVEVVDTTLDPVTDPIDDQVVEPVLDAVSPVTEPVVDALDPVIEPVDEVVADLGAGSVGDALTNQDDNTSDGNGLANDLLGGDDSNGNGDSGDDTRLLDIIADVVDTISEPLTEPVGGVTQPVVDALDSSLDPITDVLDDQLGEPVLDVVAPVTDPILDALDPITSPVDSVVGDITGGSVSDALTNQDINTSDGNGLVNDTLGGDAGDDTAAGGGGSDEVEPSDQPALLALTGALMAGEFSDDDRDGVANANDKCPRTRSGVRVLPNGCEIENLITLALSPVNFALNEALLRPEAQERLLRNIEVLQKLPLAEVEVAGHTDALGAQPYNTRLSKQRAQAVLDFLVANGIDPSRLIVRGYRDKQPVAYNDSEVGRHQNRRAELIIREAVTVKDREE